MYGWASLRVTPLSVGRLFVRYAALIYGSFRGLRYEQVPVDVLYISVICNSLERSTLSSKFEFLLKSAYCIFSLSYITF